MRLEVFECDECHEEKHYRPKEVRHWLRRQWSPSRYGYEVKTLELCYDCYERNRREYNRAVELLIESAPTPDGPDIKPVSEEELMFIIENVRVKEK